MLEKNSIRKIRKLFNLPFLDLVHRASHVHRQNFDPCDIEINKLVNVQPHACNIDSQYCNTSYNIIIGQDSFIDTKAICNEAIKAKKLGIEKICIGILWNELNDHDMTMLIEIIAEIKTLGMKICMSLGKISLEQAKILQKAGLDYYNHNLDSSEEYYPNLMTSIPYEEKLQTLENVKISGLRICCGIIIGAGESLEDRIRILHKLANFELHPEVIPINIPIQEHNLSFSDTSYNKINIFDLIRVIAVARIIMPRSRIKFAAGREQISEEAQAFCFMVGVNSIFYNDYPVMNDNVEKKDKCLFNELGVNTTFNQSLMEEIE